MQTFRKRQKTTHNCSGRILSPRQSWAAAFCAACILLCGCHQKDLVYPDSAMIKISVNFDWTYAPDADPDGMTVVFFPEDDGGHIWRYELAGRKGGRIEIPAGHYRMMAFNNDTKDIIYSGTSHMESYNAFTSESVRSNGRIRFLRFARESNPIRSTAVLTHSTAPRPRTYLSACVRFPTVRCARIRTKLKARSADSM